MQPDLLQSLVNERITELRGRGIQRSTAKGQSRRSLRSWRWFTTSRARVGQVFVRVGTSLIGEGAVHEPASIVR
jgi:hypothetical protein